MTNVLGVIEDGHWRPGIGDPTIIGWLTTGLYLAAAGLCAICAWRSDRISPVNHPRHHRVFWQTLTVVMLLMAINKQLDLQSWLMLIGRKVASAQGWYSQRQIVKKWFITGIAISSLILIMWLGWTCRRVIRHYGLALFGIMLLLTFIVVRTGSHHVKILGWEQGGVWMNYILEISSITCIGLSALIGTLRGKRQTTKTINS